jgi:hypothetical protein
VDGGNTVVLGNKLAPQEHKMKWQQTSGARNHLDMMLSREPHSKQAITY